MNIERWILLAVYVVGIGILLFIPKNKIRLAVVAFLFMRVITFVAGLVAVELGWIEYPVRIFASVNRTSFTYEFFAFPVISAAFNVWYPKGRSIRNQLIYYVAYSSTLTSLEILIEKFTKLIHYIEWEWYHTWITISVSLVLAHLFCKWFFAKTKEAV
ncbi:CBO0543 family protein [Cohnella caldifontis]|uniref:CBO0543 family protein n=1 Tax=Cohnella caldifontis TaxID=3027471 RepID=UPI0030D8F100